MNCATCDHPSGDHLEGKDACQTADCTCLQFVQPSSASPIEEPAPGEPAPAAPKKTVVKKSATIKPKSKTLAKKRG